MELVGLAIILLIIAGAYLFFIHPFVEETRRRREYENAELDQYPENGHDFEHWVATKLRGYGWRAKVTQAGGDQGIDVIAEKSDVRIGIQCKRLNKPCGNRAVQEALSGGTYYGLPNVAVLATSGFTRSTMDLAARTNCLLLTNYDLPKLDSIFQLDGRGCDVRSIDHESVLLKLSDPFERIFGKCCMIVARKSLPELKEIVLDLAEKIIDGIDPTSGNGELKVSKFELKALLDLVDIILGSSVELSPENTDFDAAPRDLGDGKREYNVKVGIDGIDIAKLKKGRLVPFFSLFPSTEVVALREFMEKLYKNSEIPLPEHPSGFLNRFLT